MNLFDVIKKSIVTEKASGQELKNGTYVLMVSPRATKIDIKKAIFGIYKMEVSSVRILNTREKFKQRGNLKKRSFRKAYVTLKDTAKKLDLSMIKV